jgi:ribonuclease-3
MGMNIDSLVRINKDRLSDFEKTLGYRFTDLRLLQRALVHSSYAFEQSHEGENNEKLEFFVIFTFIRLLKRIGGVHQSTLQQA